MVRGPRKHLKRLNAPRHWMLDKLAGKWAPRPSPGPHKLRESLPLVVLLRNRLKYALTRREVISIVAQKLIKVDAKVRTDPNYPAGIMDVVSVPKTNENFRLIYDVKGRFNVHRITPEEAKFKLLKVRKVFTSPKGVPVAVTHDGRTIRYPDPLISANDTLKFDLSEKKVTDYVKFDTGNLVLVTGGHNIGRVGVVEKKEKHPGSFDIIHVKDSAGHSFATRVSNVFVIGKGTKSLVTLPKRKGVRSSALEDRNRRLGAVTATEAK
eukprot:TRINITY_DN187_c0_g1_i2.p1 TRINITY_DN187_c0_g1~~TRINITY_DN187_c0_g1_i2.p1  ORF type:complete len:266 (+),score=44.71 TRINITY_DN187_c0_g1_i2:90-887(+)